MNKFLARTLTVTLLLMLVCTTAFAAATITAEKGSDGKITVKVSGVTAGDEASLLAVTTGTQLSTLATDSTPIKYINQATATDGTATFTFDIGDASNVTFYSGYSSMASDATPLSAVIEEEEEPSDPSGDDYKLGDVNGDGDITSGDATKVLRHVAKFITLTGNEFKAADVNKDGAVTSGDATKILRYVAKFITSFE